jgi:hypothetical protein
MAATVDAGFSVASGSVIGAAAGADVARAGSADSVTAALGATGASDAGAPAQLNNAKANAVIITRLSIRPNFIIFS